MHLTAAKYAQTHREQINTPVNDTGILGIPLRRCRSITKYDGLAVWESLFNKLIFRLFLKRNEQLIHVNSFVRDTDVPITFHYLFHYFYMCFLFLRESSLQHICLPLSKKSSIHLLSQEHFQVSFVLLLSGKKLCHLYFILYTCLVWSEANKTPLATAARKRLAGILPMLLYKRHSEKVNPVLEKEL